MSHRVIWPALALLVGCKPAPPPANPEFSDAAVYAFLAFEADEADLAFAMRRLEAQIYASIDVDDALVQDRAFTLARLTADDVAGIQHPDRPIEDAVPVAVAGASPHDVDLHVPVQLMADQTPVEPYSPNHYDRFFLDDTDACWADRGCDTLRTFNELTKKNALMSVPYELYKDFRWVDLALPDPAALDVDEVPVNEGEPRWAFAARSWLEEPFEGENGKTSIQQTYTVELWVPRDGRGPLDAGDREWSGDSSGGGTLRFMALWHETHLGLDVGDDLVSKTTRAGIDANFNAVDAFIAEGL